MALIALPAAVVVALVLALAGDSGSDEASAPPEERATATALRADRFDERRAFAFLRRQVEMGPRPAGSAASRRLAAILRERLPRGRYERISAHPRLRNVVGHIRGTRPAIVVAAHYDTKDIPGFVGANDGASGTAAVVELARGLRRARRPAGAPEIRFVLFDGEEATDDSRPFLETGVRGSRAYAARHADEVRSLVLLDFVAERGRMRIPREASSSRELWGRLRAAARRVGAQAAFPDEVRGSVLDDHTPFLRRGIPAIDLIDFTFPCFHKTCDDMSAVSAASLDMTGETVFELVRTLR